MRPSYFLFIHLVQPECSGRYLYLLVDQCVCLSSVSSVVGSNTVLASAASAVGTSMVIDYLNSEVSQPPFSQHHRSSTRSDLRWNGDQHAYICRYRKTDTPATTRTTQSRRVPRKVRVHSFAGMVSPSPVEMTEVAFASPLSRYARESVEITPTALAALCRRSVALAS